MCVSAQMTPIRIAICPPIIFRAVAVSSDFQLFIRTSKKKGSLSRSFCRGVRRRAPAAAAAAAIRKQKYLMAVAGMAVVVAFILEALKKSGRDNGKSRCSVPTFEG